jgi:plastocyanin
MLRTASVALLVAALGAGSAACGDDDDGGTRRVIDIVQTDDGCNPAAIGLQVGEKVTFKVQNDGKKDREVEGIEGMKLEEVLVPAGRTRNVNYTAPETAGTQKLKCYIPDGQATVIDVNVAP